MRARSSSWGVKSSSSAAANSASRGARKDCCDGAYLVWVETRSYGTSPCGKACQVLVEGRVVAPVGDVDGDAGLRRKGGKAAVEGVIHRAGNEGHAYAHIILFLSRRR